MTDRSPLAVGARTDGIARVLLVAAHPDDAEFGASGTVALWTAAGIEVAYVIVTNGDAGSQDPSVDRNALAALRQQEQRDAASEVGVDTVTFLGYPDGALVVSSELRRDLSRIIRSFRPERLVCPSPERNWDLLAASHPDHLAAGEAAVRAFYPDARNAFSHPELLEEGLPPFTVQELWLMAHPDPNQVVDITETFPKKIAALKRHISQVGEGKWIDETLGERLAVVGARAGLGPGRLAETFRVSVTF